MARSGKKDAPSTDVDLSAPSDPIEIVSVKELWTECRLKDGTVIRMRPVVADVRRVRNKFDPTGQPIYLVRTAIITSAKSPRKLYKKTTRREAKKT